MFLGLPDPHPDAFKTEVTYVSENPDPHSDPYQYVICHGSTTLLFSFLGEKILEMCIESRTKCGTESIRNPVVF
jgi:hypothetical protein